MAESLRIFVLLITIVECVFGQQAGCTYQFHVPEAKCNSNNGGLGYNQLEATVARLQSQIETAEMRVQAMGDNFKGEVTKLLGEVDASKGKISELGKSMTKVESVVGDVAGIREEFQDLKRHAENLTAVVMKKYTDLKEKLESLVHLPPRDGNPPSQVQHRDQGPQAELIQNMDTRSKQQAQDIQDLKDQLLNITFSLKMAPPTPIVIHELQYFTNSLQQQVKDGYRTTMYQINNLKTAVEEIKAQIEALKGRQ